MKSLILSLLVSCATRITPAPIVNATSIPDYLQIKQKVAANVNDEGDTLGSLNDNNNFLTIFPHYFNSDGFFVALFQKV